MGEDDTEVFRAVITVVRIGERWTNGMTSRTEVAGPYCTAGAAKGAIKRAERENTASYRTLSPETVTVTGHVEKASITWEAIE